MGVNFYETIDKVIFVPIPGLSIVIMIGTSPTHAMDMSNDSVELAGYPTEVSLSPKNVTRNSASYTVPFKFSFGGGTGTYHWSFNPGDGTPALSGTTTSKNTWSLYVSALSTNRSSDSGKVYWYR